MIRAGSIMAASESTTLRISPLVKFRRFAQQHVHPAAFFARGDQLLDKRRELAGFAERSAEQFTLAQVGVYFFKYIRVNLLLTTAPEISMACRMGVPLSMSSAMVRENVARMFLRMIWPNTGTLRIYLWTTVLNLFLSCQNGTRQFRPQLKR